MIQDSRNEELDHMHSLLVPYMHSFRSASVMYNVIYAVAPFVPWKLSVP